MVGTKEKKPMWADLGLRPVITPHGGHQGHASAIGGQGSRLTTLMLEKVGPPISAAVCSEVDAEWGPECVDSPHFRRTNIDCLETVQLLDESGFGFLPEADLQNQTINGNGDVLASPWKFTSKQLKVLAHLSVSGLLPDSFPHARWVMAVQRSFCTQEAAVCTCGADWEEARRILELVRTANVTLESSHGTTWKVQFSWQW